MTAPFPRQTATAALTLTRDGLIAALTGLSLTEQDRLATTWRHNRRAVAEDLLFIHQHRKTIAERNRMLTPTIRLHNPADVDRARKLLPWRLSLYLEHVKAISLAEAAMDQAGVAFAKSSDAREN